MCGQGGAGMMTGDITNGCGPGATTLEELGYPQVHRMIYRRRGEICNQSKNSVNFIMKAVIPAKQPQPSLPLGDKWIRELRSFTARKDAI